VKTVRLAVLGLVVMAMTAGASAQLRAFDGFEDGDLTNNPTWTESKTSGNVVVQSSVVANGNDAVEITASGGGAEQIVHDRGTDDSVSDGDTYQIIFRRNSIGTNEDGFFYNIANGKGTLGDKDSIGVQWGSSGDINLRVYDSAGGFKTSSTAVSSSSLSTGTFYRAELTITPSQNKAKLEVFDMNNNSLGSTTTTSTSGATNLQFATVATEDFDSTVNTNFFVDDVSFSSSQVNQEPQFGSTSITPDPPLIGQTADFSYTANDPDGTISSVDLTLKDDGTTVFTGSKSSASGTFSPPDQLTQGDITAEYTATDNNGATATTTLSRTLADTDPQLSLTGTSGTQFTKAASYTVDTTATDNVPNEQLTCTLSSGYTTFDQRTVTEGDQYTVQPSLRVGTTDTDVTCVENDGNQTTSQALTTTVKAFEFQSVQADKQEAIEKTGQDYFATFKHADFAEEIDLELNYNGGVEDTVTRQLSGVSTETVSATAETPLVSDANKSFDFDFTADVTFTNRTGGTDTTTKTSTKKSQKVFRKILTDCTNAVKGVTGPQAQKIVLKNETEQSIRVQGDIEYNYDVSTSGSSHTRNYAFTETNTQSATTCLYPDFAEYQISGPVSYEASGFGKRVFPVQNTTITNSSTTLPLFLLPDSESTDTVIRVETPSGSPIDGTVKVLRFDVGTNTFTTAAKLETGSDGEAEVGLEDGAFYEFVVQNKDGEVIFTRDQQQFTPQTVPATVTLTVGQELPDFVENQDGFTFKVEEIKSNGNITGLEATVNHDTSGLQNATLKVDKNAVIGENTICEKTVQTSASTLFCDFNETAEGNQFSFVLSSFVQGDRFVLQTGSIDKTKGLFGINQVFAGFLVFMSLSAFGFVTPLLTVMFSTAGVIAAYTLGLISVGVGAMASLVAVALIVTFAGERTV